jgi:hypothetical protein
MTVLDVPVHPEFAEHGGFGHLRLGRKEKVEDARTVEFAKYLNEAALPMPPDTVDYGTAVPNYPMYGNDALGDCTAAAAGHLVQAWSQAAGGMKIMDPADIEKMYWETGNPPAATGVAGSAEDDGRSELDVLNYWRKDGIAAGESWADRIAAFAAVDIQNLYHVKAAIYLCGGVYAGAGMPLTAQGQHVWDVVADAPDAESKPYSWGGHAFPIVAYDETGYLVVTWGALVKMTNAFFAAYVDEVYAIASPDFTAGGMSPGGFDLAQLEADVTALTAA